MSDSEDIIRSFCVGVLSEAGICTIEKDRIIFKNNIKDPGTMICFPGVIGLTRADLHDLFVNLLKQRGAIVLSYPDSINIGSSGTAGITAYSHIPTY